MKIKASDHAGYMKLSAALDKKMESKKKAHLSLNFDIRNKEQQDTITKCLMALSANNIQCVTSVTEKTNRSLEQNAMWSAMYKQLFLQCAFDSFLDARAYCKWTIGIPILKRDKEGFEKSFDTVFGKFTSNYEACLRLMNSCSIFPVDGFPVTSNFNITQGTEYIANIASHFCGVDAPQVDFSDILS
jgi:hypothetical protein